jgi:hypothetical protein
MNAATLSRHLAREATWLRASLVAVWLITALASALEMNGRSAGLLAAAGIHSPALAATALWGGVALDVVVGLALCFAPLRAASTLAIAATLLLTLVATALLPSLWLDPLGPLSKNLPILASLLVLRGRSP